MKPTANTMQQLHLQLDTPQDTRLEGKTLIHDQSALEPLPLQSPVPSPEASPETSPETTTKQQTSPEQQPITPVIPEYKLVRSRRRTLGITVHRGVVEVRAPLRAPKYWINEFIVEKQHWIQAQVDQQRAQLKNIYRIFDGSEIPILGKPITIKLFINTTATGAPIKRQRALLNGSVLSLYFTQDCNTQGCSGDTTHIAHESERIATQIFLKWVKNQAADYMSNATRKLADAMGLGDHLNQVKYRRTSSKWGHCTSDGVIQYNPLIIAAPLFVVDYIIAHEVCHLRHANHSRRYWNLVDQVCKQRAEAENWLTTQGYKLAIEAG